MAVQLCHLIISLECDRANYSGIQWDLEQIADNLSKSTEHFAHVAIRLNAQCDDKCLKEEMEQAANAVLIIGKNMLLAVQKLCIQPSVQKHHEELIIAAQSILLGTLKILQIEDDADVRKICQAADWVLDCLIFLQTAESMSHLLTCFREFSEALLLLNSLTQRRIMDLKDSLHQENLSGTLQILRKCVPMLYTATQSNITHKQNEQMTASKKYVFDLAAKTVQELKLLLTNGIIKQSQVTQRTTFSQQIHLLTEILTNTRPSELHRNDIDFNFGTIVFYSMFVADCSRPKVKSRLVSHCQHILEFRKKIFDHLIATSDRSPQAKNYFELENVCYSMKDELNCLNETLVSAIFYLILDTFSDAKDPLKRLLKNSLKTGRKTDHHIQNPFASKSFPPLLQEFHSHANQLLKVASLVSAHCAEEKTKEKIQNSADYLRRVRDDLVALFVGISKTHCVSKNLEWSQSIYHRWAHTIDNLLISFDGMVSVNTFVQMSVKEIEQNKRSCEELLGSQDYETFRQHAADLCGLVVRVIQVVSRYVDQSKDPIFRNGLRVLVRQLDSSLTETKSTVAKCSEFISSATAQKFFLEKTKCLFEMLYNVLEGVNGYKHPDLMSPLRTEVHPNLQKPLFIDFCESKGPPDSQDKTYKDFNTCLFSNEGFLSKPLPLSSSPSSDSTRSSSTINNMELTDLKLMVDNLTMAAQKLDNKEVYTYCSSLVEIAKTYIDTSKELLSLDELANSETLNYNDIEALVSHLVQFSKNGNINSVSNMGSLIQAAVFLSHRIDETKQNLVSKVRFWYDLSYQVFCSPDRSDVARNVQLFSRTMQSLEAIIKILSESFNSSQHDEEPALFSGNQESHDKIKSGWTKLQVIAKYLLSKGCSTRLQADKAKLDAKCVLWSAILQQLLKSADEFTGVTTLFVLGTKHLTNLNIIESNSLALLCETSLWLQEATTLLTANCTVEGEHNNIVCLKKQVELLTEAILKARDDTHTSTFSSIFLTAVIVLQQRELTVKLKLLMYHLKTIYKRYHNSMRKVVGIAISSANISFGDKISITENFERELYTDLDDTTLVLIKQSLQMDEPSGMKDNHSSDSCSSRSLKDSLVERNVSEQKNVVENEQNHFNKKEEEKSIHMHSNNVVYEQNASCGDKLIETHSRKFNSVCQEKQSIKIQQSEEIQQKQLNDPNSSVIQIYETFNRMLKTDDNNQEQPTSDGKILSNKELVQTINEQSNVTFIKDMGNLQKELPNQKTEIISIQEITNKQTEGLNKEPRIEGHIVQDQANFKQQMTFNVAKQELTPIKTHATLKTNKNIKRQIQKVKKESNITLIVQEIENSLKASGIEKLETAPEKEPTNESIGIFKEQYEDETQREKELDKMERKITHKVPQNLVFAKTQTAVKRDRQVSEMNEIAHKESNLTLIENEIESSLQTSTNQTAEIFLENENVSAPIRVFIEKPRNSMCREQELDNSKTQNKPNRVERHSTFARPHTALKKGLHEKVCWLKSALVKENQQNTDRGKPQMTYSGVKKKGTVIGEQKKGVEAGLNASARCHSNQNFSLNKKLKMNNPTILYQKSGLNCRPREETHAHNQMMAKCPLADELETWEGENNVVVQITREMASHMSFMIQYLNRKGPIKTTDQLIASAKCIASNGQNFVKFVRIMVKNCLDKRSSAELQCGMEQIQTISNQLNIVSSVKAATGCDDSTGEDVLVKNAQNLIHSVLQTWKAAEAACLTGTGNPACNKEEADVAVFCSYLRKKLGERSKEFSSFNM
ncbi:catenin alpha-2-like isoform X4 [Pelobates cultripes]|uniref:Catenin alpha-2-like isoform X4 n=1 Tax=Pelobates cultripes TaxID=61616 RepID=A0AAD1VTN1_PELCU|nr:catenin alpha-2-like isoform X4 [Pelobates cultripes]